MKKQTIKSAIAIMDNCYFDYFHEGDKEHQAWKFLKAKLENYEYIVNTINRVSGSTVQICEDLIALKQRTKI